MHGETAGPLSAANRAGGEVQSRVCAVVAALLDDHVGSASFDQTQVLRPEVARLVELVEVVLTDGGDQLLSGEVEIEVQIRDTVRPTRLTFPPGSPQNPPAEADLRLKIADCLDAVAVRGKDIPWKGAAALLRTYLTRAAA